MNSEFWNARFGSSEYAYGTTPNDFLREAFMYIPASGEVLCTSEGEGRNSVFLAEKKFQVSAVDISIEGRKKAKKLAKDRKVSVNYMISDLEEYDFGENKWDGIVSIFGFIGHDATARKAVYEQIHRALKPNGVFILEAYHPRQLAYDTGGPKERDLLLTTDEFKAAFENKGFFHLAERERHVMEGTCHTGKSYVTQLIYKKRA